MGLFKRKRVWWMSFTYQGRQIRRSTGTENKKCAKKILDHVQMKINDDKFFDPVHEEGRTFTEMIERYLTQCSIKKVQASQVRDRQIVKHLLVHFGEAIRLVDITPRVINAYKTARREEGAAPATVNKELGVLRHAYNVAIREWEWCRDNPVQRVTMEPVNNQIERWLTPEEEVKLLAASPPLASGNYYLRAPYGA